MNIQRKPKTLAVIALIIGIAAMNPASVSAQIPAPQLGEDGGFLSSTARDEWIQAVIREYPFYFFKDRATADKAAANAAKDMGGTIFGPKNYVQ